MTERREDALGSLWIAICWDWLGKSKQFLGTPGTQIDLAAHWFCASPYKCYLKSIHLPGNFLGNAI